MINELLVICVYDLRATGIILYLGFQNPCYLLVPVLLEVLVKTGCSQSTAFKLHLPGNKYFINILMYYKYYFYILFYQNSIIMPTLELQDPRELKKKKSMRIYSYLFVLIYFIYDTIIGTLSKPLQSKPFFHYNLFILPSCYESSQSNCTLLNLPHLIITTRFLIKDSLKCSGLVLAGMTLLIIS